MSTGTKILIFVVIAILIGGIFYAINWGKRAWDKVNFSKPKLQGLDLQGLTLQDLQSVVLSGTQKEIKVGLSMDITNDNSFSIPFSGLRAKLYYDGDYIAETSNVLANKEFNIPAKNPDGTPGKLTASDMVTINLNFAPARKMIIQKIQTGQAKIEYTVKVKVFNIPLPSIKNDFPW